MDSLLKKLGGLPLAIVQAGQYIRETGTTFQRYLCLYETSWSDLLAENPRLRDYPNGSIQTTWTISYERVKELDPAAAKLLELWAYFDSQDLYFVFLERGSQSSETPDWFQDIVRSEIAFNRVMKTLIKYSLVESHQGNESYSIHPVVHDWCLESMSKGNAHLIALALTIVGFAARFTLEAEEWKHHQRLVPHANRSVQQLSAIDEPNATIDQECADAFLCLGTLYTIRGNESEAEEIYQRALNGKEKANGLGHATTHQIIIMLGLSYHRQGKLVEAERLYQRALNRGENVGGPKDGYTLEIVHLLGDLYTDQGKFIEAEKTYLRGLDTSKEAWAPDYTTVLNTVSGLGFVYQRQGKLMEAEKLLEGAVNTFEEALGPESEYSLKAVESLGRLYAYQDKLIEAEKMLKRAFDGYEKELGPEHVSALFCLSSLAKVYADQGQWVQAEKMLQRALKGCEKLMGADHIITIGTRHELNDLKGEISRRAEQSEEKSTLTRNNITTSRLGKRAYASIS